MADNDSTANKMALALGFFSIGLGLSQILAPKKVSKLAGVKSKERTMRSFGMREVATGIGILSSRNPAPWIWARVAGDAMDLASLGTAMRSRRTDKRRIVATAAAVAGVAALDVLCTRKLTKNGAHKTIDITKAITIDRSPEDLYEFWRNFENLPLFMNHLKTVECLGENLSHWEANGPAGTTVKWDAELTGDIPNKSVAWRTTQGKLVDHSGSVQFEQAHGGRGTVVKVKLQYHPTGGVVGAKVAKLFGEAPEQQIAVDLRRFKQLMETGEVSRTEGQSAGRPRSTSKKYDDFVRA